MFLELLYTLQGLERLPVCSKLIILSGVALPKPSSYSPRVVWLEGYNHCFPGSSLVVQNPFHYLCNAILHL